MYTLSVVQVRFITKSFHATSSASCKYLKEHISNYGILIEDSDHLLQRKRPMEF